jgi:hypothetical protein
MLLMLRLIQSFYFSFDQGMLNDQRQTLLNLKKLYNSLEESLKKTKPGITKTKLAELKCRLWGCQFQQHQLLKLNEEQNFQVLIRKVKSNIFEENLGKVTIVDFGLHGVDLVIRKSNVVAIYKLHSKVLI